MKDSPHLPRVGRRIIKAADARWSRGPFWLHKKFFQVTEVTRWGARPRDGRDDRPHDRPHAKTSSGVVSRVCVVARRARARALAYTLQCG